MMRRFAPVAALAALTLLVFWKVVFHGEFTLLRGGDMAVAYYPWFDVASYWLKKGVLLLWDPYVYAGKANMGEPQPGIFYPLNWVFMLLPSRSGGVNLDGLQSLIILNYLLACLSAYLLARSFRIRTAGSLLAGACYAFGGFFTQIYGYLNVLSGFVWMPLALLFFRRSLQAGTRPGAVPNVALSGLFLALSFLPGHHVPAIHTGFLLFLYCVFFLLANRDLSWPGRLRRVGLLGATAATALLLTVFQWLPSAQWARLVYRWIGSGDPVRWGQKVPYSVLEHTSNLSPQDALSLLLPYASTNANLYVGGVVAFLALIGVLFARRNGGASFFAAASVLYFMLSWGRFSALHGWFNTFIPGLWFARELFYYLIPFQLCIALLAGWGLDELHALHEGRSQPALARFLRRAAWGIAALVLFSALLLCALYYYKGIPLDHPFATALAGLACFLTVLGLLLFMSRAGRIGAGVFETLVVLLVAADLSSNFSRDLRAKNPPPGEENTYVRSFWKAPPVVERLREKRRSEIFRVDDPSGIFPPNYGDAWRLEAAMGHGATALVDFMHFRGTGWGPGSNATALLNVVYFPSRVPAAGMEPLAGDGDPLYRNPRAVPRAFVASRYRCFASRQEMLDWLPTPLFSPRDTVLLECRDMEPLAPEFLSGAWRDAEGIAVACTHRRTAGDKQAEAVADETLRFRTALFQAPWGWSDGDEIALRLEPEEAGYRYFVQFKYLAGEGPPSRITMEFEGAGRREQIQAELPSATAGSIEGERWLRAGADLGVLEKQPYRLSFHRTAECSARIDSLRIARSLPLAEAEAAGSAEITMFEPNRIRVRAELERPSFLVLSETSYPGWEAHIDGKPAPLLTGDYMLRAIPVPAGVHDVLVRFRPATFQWGLVAGIAALAGILAVLLRR